MSLLIAEASGSSVIRRACVAAGLLVLFLQGSSAGHMVLVEHSKCAEHGELVHNAEAHGHDAAAHASPESFAFRGTSNTDSETAHDHCLLAAQRRDALTPVADAQVTAALLRDATQVFAASDVVIFENAPRFRVAPKNSPPA